jgi:hypothetical protein
VFDWLFEGKVAVYLFLAAVAVSLVYLWTQTRKRYFLYGVGVTVLLAGLYFLLDKAVETDREQIVHKTEAMAAAVKAKDIRALFEHVSDQFRSPAGKDKQQSQISAQKLISSGEVTEVTVWGFHFDDDGSRERRSRVVAFQVKAEGSLMGVTRGVPFTCEATFDFDAQHGWRLKGFKLFKFGTNEEIPVPF